MYIRKKTATEEDNIWECYSCNVAVYIDDQSEIATCPLDEFRAEFSRIQAA